MCIAALIPIVNIQHLRKINWQATRKHTMEFGPTLVVYVGEVLWKNLI